MKLYFEVYTLTQVHIFTTSKLRHVRKKVQHEKCDNNAFVVLKCMKTYRANATYESPLPSFLNGLKKAAPSYYRTQSHQ